MDRYFRKESAPKQAGASPPSAAGLFAQAVLDKPVPSASAAEAEARAKREQYEFLAAIAPERARELRGQLCAEVDARDNRELLEFLEQIAPERAHELRDRLSEEADPLAEREQLEWPAAISPRHESQLRSRLRTVAERSQSQARRQWPADGSSLHEAQWDSAKHPKGGYPQNRGWWSPTGGSGSAGQPTSKPDRAGADGQPKPAGQTGVPPLMLELANAWGQTDSLLRRCRRDIETLRASIESQQAELARGVRYVDLAVLRLAKDKQDLETAKALVPQLEDQLRSLEKEYHDLGYDDIEYSTWSAGEMRVGGRGIEQVGGALQMGGAPAGLKPTGDEFNVALAAVPIFRLGKSALGKALVKAPANVAGGALRPPVPLGTRVGEIHGALDTIAQAQRTTAILETSNGTRIVASGGRDLTPAQKALLGPGDVAAKLPRAHAELTALDHAAQNGLLPAQITASRPFCQECIRAIEAAGGKITSPTRAIFPR